MFSVAVLLMVLFAFIWGYAAGEDNAIKYYTNLEEDNNDLSDLQDKEVDPGDVRES